MPNKLENNLQLSKRNRFYLGKLLIINILLFLLIILVIEGLVRWFFPVIKTQVERNRLQDVRIVEAGKFGTTYGLKPNVEGTTFGAKVVTDQRGFRIDPTLPVSQDKKNIIFLGDSVAMGVGVEASLSFPYLLARKLRNYNIINTAVSGYSLADYQNILESLLPSPKIEGIVICYCLNDIDTTSQNNIVSSLNKGDTGERDVHSFNIRYTNIFIRYLRLFNDYYFNFNDFLKTFYCYHLIKAMASDCSRNYFLADLSFYKKPGAACFLASQLANLNEIALRNKKWLVICILPYEYQLRQNKDELLLLPQKMLLSISKKQKIIVIDLSDKFKNYLHNNRSKSKDLFLFNDPMHLSDIGHKIVCDIIYHELTDRKLVE